MDYSVGVTRVLRLLLLFRVTDMFFARKSSTTFSTIKHYLPISPLCVNV